MKLIWGKMLEIIFHMGTIYELGMYLARIREREPRRPGTSKISKHGKRLSTPNISK